MPTAGSFTREFKSPDEVVKPDLLETFPSKEGLGLEAPAGMIYTKTKEFSAVCPFSGLPDIADLEIFYIPDEKILELKSLKEYVLSYRDAGIYQEHATRRIFDDLYRALFGDKTYGVLAVRMKYNVRGGFDTVTLEGGSKLVMDAEATGMVDRVL